MSKPFEIKHEPTTLTELPKKIIPPLEKIEKTTSPSLNIQAVAVIETNQLTADLKKQLTEKPILPPKTRSTGS